MNDSLEQMQAKRLEPGKVLRAVDVAAIACGPALEREVYTWAGRR